mmetsp:Transcript_3107/g.6608  ORF Transcript_3107/g.6608 Transcript_3107/m.6608 type:complete len:693 (-) Transcript_3107:240-2318(-)
MKYVALLLTLGLYSIGASSIEKIDGVRVSDTHGDGCTSIIVGPNGAEGGGTMTTHTDDCMECDFRISKVPAADWPANSERLVYTYRAAYPRWLGYGRGATYEPENTDFSIYPWKVGEGPHAPIGSIPQVAHTFGYIDGGYGIMNEHQVSIGESTCGSHLTALPVSKGGTALLEAGELSRLALERCATAKCAVELMGSMATTHGYYGADATQGEGGEALQVVDPTDAWVFHIAADDTGSSAVWAAQRVPKGHIAVVANQFIIRQVNLSDTENFLGSDNLLEVAERAGLWDSRTQGELVDFTAAFALDRGHMSPYANRRRWRVSLLAAPSLSSQLPAECSTFGDEYPFSVPVDKALKVADVIAMNRDHYEGTPFDMTRGLPGGPFGDPSRFDPGSNRAVYAHEKADSTTQLELDSTDDDNANSGQFERAISMYRCSYNWVAHASPHLPTNLLGVVWFGQYAPHASTAVPLYAGIAHVPQPFATGSLNKASLDVSYWIHAILGNWADRLYVHTIGDIQAKQSEVEGALFAAQPAVEAAVHGLLLTEKASGQEVSRLLTETSSTAAEGSLLAFSELLMTMLAKYKDGQRIDDFHAETLAPTKLFYPLWWLESVGFYNGDSMPPAVEGAPAPAALAFTLAGVLSHALTATFACVATMVYFKHRKLGDRSPTLAQKGMGVQLSPFAAPSTRTSYQQIS